jgi:hypothetical protein
MKNNKVPTIADFKILPRIGNIASSSKTGHNITKYDADCGSF